MSILQTKEGHVVYLDDEDYERFQGKVLHLIKRGTKRYVGYTETGKRRFMLHRIILGARKGDYVEFRDGNIFNCTRANLQFTHRKQQPVYPNIFFLQRLGEYAAVVRHENQLFYVGRFRTQAQALQAQKAFQATAPAQSSVFFVWVHDVAPTSLSVINARRNA